MDKYLAIITTALVITQVIRLCQNTIQLIRQKILYEKQLGQLEDVTEEDFEVQKKYYRLAVDWFEDQKEDNTADWVDLGSFHSPRWKCSKCFVVKHQKTAHCPECGRQMGGYYG